MRANVMLVSAGVTVMAAAVAGPIVLFKTWKAEPAAAAPAAMPEAPRDPKFIPVSRENQGMPDAAAQPAIIEEKGVAYFEGDEDVAAFLDLSQPCTETWGVSMKEFLQMRVRQARGSGIAQAYKLMTFHSHGKPVVTVLEDTHRTSGEPLAGIPENVTYQYAFDWPNVQLVAARPNTTSADPLAFFQARRSAACEGKLSTMNS